MIKALKRSKQQPDQNQPRSRPPGPLNPPEPALAAAWFVHMYTGIGLIFAACLTSGQARPVSRVGSTKSSRGATPVIASKPRSIDRASALVHGWSLGSRNR